jgi:exodeoxyribonuclease VII small subunit
MPKAPKPPTPDSMSYEQAIGELESLIQRIEQGEVGLEESLAEYRRGAALLKRCRSILETAQAQIEELTADGAEGD